MRVQLTPHPALGHPDLTIDAEAEREGTELLLRYAVRGEVGRIRLPAASAQASRRDELWRHTCFEAFVRPARSEAYHELNLSLSNDWAFYHFEKRRSVRSDPDVPHLTFDYAAQTDRLTVRASIDLATLVSPAVPWELNLTAVIEDQAGNLSYWALAHPPGVPDFHDPDCFVLELPPPTAE
jgi:hypothetical protein